VSKKIYRILIVTIISVLIFFVMVLYTEKINQNGKALELKMTENVWLGTEHLYDTEENNEQDSREAKEETNTPPNPAVLKWGDMPQYELRWNMKYILAYGMDVPIK